VGAIASAAALQGCATLTGSMKVSKATAQYRDAPNHGQRCGDCVFYIPPGVCHIVEGFISSNGWSRYYTARPRSG
jgi:hypothetical protein